MKKHSNILFFMAIAALAFVPARRCGAACWSMENIDSKNKVPVYLITITEAESADVNVIFKKPRSEGPKIPPELYKSFTEEQIQEMIKKHIPLSVPDPKDVILSEFYPDYWKDSGMAVKDCEILETATGVFQSNKFTEEAFPYPIAVVAYKLIVKDAPAAVWKIFNVTFPGQAVPATPEDLLSTENSLFGTLNIEMPTGPGSIKLKYTDNKHLMPIEKELALEETWNLPYQQSLETRTEKSVGKDQSPQSPSGHIIKLINHGVYLLDLAPEKDAGKGKGEK